MKRIAATMRHHWQFFLIVPILTIIMTWPTLRYVFDVNTLWLPSDDLDQGLKIWDGWYGGRILTGEAQLYYTNLLFAPRGLSLVFHNFSFPHILLLFAAGLLLPPANAYSLCFMLVSLLNAAASYVFLFDLFRDRWLSLFGSVVFGLSVFVIEHPVHPDLSSVAVIPLAMVCLRRWLAEWRMRWIVFAGVVSGVTAFTSMYILVCLAISVGLYLLFQLPKQWRERQFWSGMVLLLLVAGAIGAFRIYPMIGGGELNEALEKGGGREIGGDLLDLFAHKDNFITEHVFASLLRQPLPPVREDGYIGYVTLCLVAIGLVTTRPRRLALIWLALFLIFFSLRLGPALTINGVVYDNIVLPKFYLNQLFPAAFKAFWITAYFHVGMLLPVAVLAVYGMKRLLAAFPAKSAKVVILACLALNLAETIEPPDSYTMPDGRLDYIDFLRSEERQEEIRLIHLPFGRGPSKRYLLYQSFSGYPQVEGLASRTPAAAYSYIEANLLLNAWRDDESVLCLPFNRAAFRHALEQLLADGFSHVILHNDGIRPIRFAKYSVMSIQPTYQDEFAHVYRLSDLRENCHEDALLRPGVLPELAAFMTPSASAEPPDAQLPPIALPLAYDGLALGPPVSLAHEIDIDSLLQDDGIAIAVWYPAHSAGDLAAAASGRLARELKTCGGKAGAGGARIEYFTRVEIPCDLLFGADPLAVGYENGALLANALLRVDGDMLELDLLWNALPESVHGASIQAFNRAGEKATNSDFTIHHDPLYRHRLDLSPLAPGDYDIRLILYDFASGVSVPGAVIASDTPFQRELDVGLITIE